MSVPDIRGDGASPPGRRSRRFLRSKRTWVVLAAAATGTTQSCSGPLTGSTFAGGDGNLKTSPTTFGTTDWENVAGLNKGIDLTSGGTDNSFGQGTKEDDPNVSVVTGSIPPQKSDLTRFYEASE